jgi:SAM-dependent methyltransferase
MTRLLRRAVQPIFARAPHLRSLALSALELGMRPALMFYRLDRPRSDAPAARLLEARAVEFNRAAEVYYAAHANAAQLLDKPFSEPDALARRLTDVGVLIDGLRLRPGDTVLDLGAGTCWLSHLLNRFGCRTIAVDVSTSALSIGRRVFERDPATNWGLDPQFLDYDGRTLPVPDGSVDRVVLYDAYHHLPNPGPLLREMRRVLRPEGIVGMSEPGRGHAASAPSVAEAEATGVLENELVLEDIGELALASGFTAARVLVAGRPPTFEIPVSDLRAFMGGRGFARYWKSFCAGLDGHHYVLLFTGDPMPTTRRPKLLRASMIPGRMDGMKRAEPGSLELQVHNAGDTRWLSAERVPGWTRLGAHLYRVSARVAADPGPPGARTLVDFDWLRVQLPADVLPSHTTSLLVPLPPIDQSGDYVFVFDLVIEGEAWFADRGSRPLEVSCRVG